jgi:hypothetical protein
MADGEKSTENKWSTRIALGKDAVGFLRDGSLFFLLILLLVFPGTFNDVLVRAGFEEGSLAGFKWKKQVVQSDQALVDANATISDLRQQLEKTSAALSDAQGHVHDQELQATLSKLATENRQVGATTQQVQKAVQSTIAAGSSLVAKAEATLDSDTSWAVVFGGDKSVEAAQDEIRRAVGQGIDSATILLRQGSYRSVAFAKDRKQAEQIVGIAREWRPDAYIVRLSTWCPQRTSKGDYAECNTAG